MAQSHVLGERRGPTLNSLVRGETRKEGRSTPPSEEGQRDRPESYPW